MIGKARLMCSQVRYSGGDGAGEPPGRLVPDGPRRRPALRRGRRAARPRGPQPPRRRRFRHAGGSEQQHHRWHRHGC